MKPHFFFALMLVIFLASCSGTQIPGTATNLPFPTDTRIATSTRVASPAQMCAASPDDCLTTTTPAAGEAYPVATQASTLPAAEPGAYPVGQQVLPTPPNTTPAPTAPLVTAVLVTPAAGNATAQTYPPPNQAAPFQDCARTPGLMQCAPQAREIPARLAFIDSAVPRLIGLDLQTGFGWQTPLEQRVYWMEWDPTGARLLLSLPDSSYQVYSDGGKRASTFQEEGLISWASNGFLNRNGVLLSSEGWKAQLTQNSDMAWELHIQTDQEVETIIPLETPYPDLLFSLRAWVPGTRKLLVQSYFASNAAMVQGGEVLLVDSVAKTVQDMGVTAPLDDTAFAFNPALGTQLAMLVTGGEPPPVEGARRLALVDLPSGQIRYPLPQGISVGELAWRPDGQRLAFVINSPASGLSAEAQRTFPSQGIYLLDPQLEAVNLLVQSSPEAYSGAPFWLPDGQTLLFARLLPRQGGGQSVEIEKLLPGEKSTMMLVNGLPEPQFIAGWPLWRSVFDMAQK